MSLIDSRDVLENKLLLDEKDLDAMQNENLMYRSHNYFSAETAISSRWSPLLSKDLSARAQEIALSVATKMRDPNHVQRTALLAQQQSQSGLNWDLSVPTSAKDLALFYSYVASCFPDQGWDKIGLKYLRLIAQGTQQRKLNHPSLLGGIAGIAFAVQASSQNGQHYQKTLEVLHHAICDQIAQRDEIWKPIERKNGIHFSDYDLVYGAAGILSYLVRIEQPDKRIEATISTLAKYLLWLTEPEQQFGQERWFRPPHTLPDTDRDATPQGDFNCGVSHGIAGVLAALALTALAGYTYPGLHASLRYISSWLLAHQVNDQYGSNWPKVVPLSLANTPDSWQMLPTSRATWCYGAPGIARSLYLTGIVLQDETLNQVAISSIEAVLRHPITQLNIYSSNLCHGLSGLLLICLRFAHEEQRSTIALAIPSLVEQIVTVFNADAPLGFRDQEPHNRLVDQPDWLNGAPGVAMALLAASTPVEPTWDRLMLLS